MHLHILAIGRAKKSAEASITADYMARLPKGSQLYEAESRLPYGPARAKDESDKLLALYHSKKPKSAKLIALDPHGRNISSPDLAKMISTWRDGGIGAAYLQLAGQMVTVSICLIALMICYNLGRQLGLICYFALC